MKSVLRDLFLSLMIFCFISVSAESLSGLDSITGNSIDTLAVSVSDSISKKRRTFEFSTPKKNFRFVPYGFIRNDFYYDSRQNFETASGLFYIIPKDEDFNLEGEDLNSIPQSGFLSIASRLGVKVFGPKVFNANSYAQLETDFAGFQQVQRC